jgi:hypothetical protein
MSSKRLENLVNNLSIEELVELQKLVKNRIKNSICNCKLTKTGCEGIFCNKIRNKKYTGKCMLE